MSKISVYKLKLSAQFPPKIKILAEKLMNRTDIRSDETLDITDIYINNDIKK